MIPSLTSPYTKPTKGRQTVQTYYPSRGEQYQLQISTYNGSSWNIVFCSHKDKAKVCAAELKRVSN